MCVSMCAPAYTHTHSPAVEQWSTKAHFGGPQHRTNARPNSAAGEGITVTAQGQHRPKPTAVVGDTELLWSLNFSHLHLGANGFSGFFFFFNFPIIPNASLEAAVASPPLQWDWFWCSRYRQRVALRPDTAPLVLYNCKQIHITKPHFREPLSEHFLVSRELESKIQPTKIKISDFSLLLSLQILRLKHKTSILQSCPLTPQDIGTGICELSNSQTLTLSLFGQWIF